MNAAISRLSGWRSWVALSGLSVLFVCDLFIETAIVSKFRRIFDDALPGVTLPSVTQFLLDDQVVTAGFAFLWLILGIWIICRLRIEWLLLIYGAIGLQIGITIYALFAPITHLNIGMSSAP